MIATTIWVALVCLSLLWTASLTRTSASTPRKIVMYAAVQSFQPQAFRIPPIRSSRSPYVLPNTWPAYHRSEAHRLRQLVRVRFSDADDSTGSNRTQHYPVGIWLLQFDGRDGTSRI